MNMARTEEEIGWRIEGGRTWSYANEAGDLRSSLFIVVLQPSRVDARLAERD